MTPEQKIKHLILLRYAETTGEALPEITSDTIDDVYDEVDPTDDTFEFREGEIETDIPTASTRHYEAKAVAAKYIDGSWVGWTYWYGGGKHGNPEEIRWMEDAYNLSVTEEEKLVIVRTFKKIK